MRVLNAALGAVLVAVVFVAVPSEATGQGGCGSVCVPLEVLDPERTQVLPKAFRFTFTTEYGDFDRFVEGDDPVTNRGGNKAIIHETALFVDYGASRRLTVSVLLPYIRKIQQTRRFGERTADGLGDIAVFGRYELLLANLGRGPSVSAGLGLKFPTGSIGEPGGGAATLPPPFQNGSGAYDVMPTISYYQGFSDLSLFGSSFLRIPLEHNENGYKFGHELEVHFGVLYPLPVLDAVQLVLAMDHLNAGRDEDSRMTLPAGIRDGMTVLNTGGVFTSVSPGVRWQVAPRVAMTARVFLPVQENWNGARSRNVGQVAPDFTGQFTMSYTMF